MEELLTPADVAQLLRVDISTVVDLLESGEIVAFRVGPEWRILPQSLVEFIAIGAQQQQLSVLERALSDPRAWARALEDFPELKESISAKEFPAGTAGAFLQQGTATLDAERDSGKVIELNPKPKK